jgi:hypothetical protein
MEGEGITQASLQKGPVFRACSVQPGRAVLTTEERDMKNNHLKLAALVGVLAVTTGCLRKDVAETWYVDAAGAVTWVIQEQNVRSDAQSPLDRRTEENEYWLAVQQERHEIAEGMRELRGEKLRTVVLRSESPYTVQTEARFPGLDILGQRLIAAVGTTGTSIVRRNQSSWEWTMVVRDPSALDATTEPSDGVGAVLNDLDHLRVVLISGRFEEGDGFELSNDGRIATFKSRESDHKTSDAPAITLKLAWKGFE